MTDNNRMETISLRMLVLSLLMGLGFAGSASGEEGAWLWPAEYKHVCGGGEAGSAAIGFAQEVNQRNKGLKEACNDKWFKTFRQELTANAKDCGQSGRNQQQKKDADQIKGAAEKWYEGICQRAKVSAQRAVQLCDKYDKEGQNALNEVQATTASIKPGQDSSFEAASAAVKKGMSGLSVVKLAADDTSNIISKKLQESLNSHKKLLDFQKGKKLTPACQKLHESVQKLAKQGGKLVYPNMNALRKVAGKIGQSAEAKIKTFGDHAKKLDADKSKLNGASNYPDFYNVMGNSRPTLKP